MKAANRYCTVLLIVFISLFFISCASLNQGRKSAEPGKDDSAASDGGDMIKIPRGWFTMGSNISGVNERPEHRVYVGAFRIDKYEVTAKDFSEFLNAKGNAEEIYFSHDNYSTIMGVATANGKTVETRLNPERYVPRSGFENYPANNVSWFGADAYCRWKGKRLPTEAEWEKAARGDDRRTYPWGNDMPTDKRARYNQKWEQKGLGAMVPVDALPEGASYYGVLNMAGNTWEWIGDWYRQNYCAGCEAENASDDCDLCDVFGGAICFEAQSWFYTWYRHNYYDPCRSYLEEETSPAFTPLADNSICSEIKLLDVKEAPAVVQAGGEEGPQISKHNPRGPASGRFKVLRGGSWYDSAGDLTIRSTYRYWFDPIDRFLNVGFRCVK